MADYIDQGVLVNVPVADVAPVVHGRWIVDERHNREPYCSECDYEPLCADTGNYCPNCGAKMDLEAGDEFGGANKLVNVQTNADRIRAMSDEALAKANVRRTRKTNDEYCWSVYITSDGEEFENYEIALKHETEWLQQPTEEET